MELTDEWKFKENAPKQGSSDGFWYDLTMGGYITPKDVLEDPEQIEALNNAIHIVSSFEMALEDNDLLNEF